jgi:GNAT superfamily N-acetyltransferase
MIYTSSAKPEQIQILYQLICDAAEESGNRAEVTTTPEKLLNDGFGTFPVFQAIIAWEDREAVGFALYYPMYSAWKGHRTYYVEDLFVRPLWRRRQIGKKLFLAIMENALRQEANLAWECDRDDMRLRHSFISLGAIDRSHKVSFYMEPSEMREQLRDAEKDI